MHDPLGLYSALGLPVEASAGEIKRAFRTLRTKAHPDKGGDAEAFNTVVKAHNVLSDPEKRRLYDETGQVQKSASEVFVEGFAGGVFSDRVGRTTAAAASVTSMADQIAIRQTEAQKQSHTAGFEAWLRSRGNTGATVYTSDTIAEQFGVVKSSYESVPLAARSVLSVLCKGSGKLQDQLGMVARPLPSELEWGQVLVEVKYAPVTPADIYTVRLGGLYDQQSKDPPFVAGHDAVAVVTKVGPGVKDLTEGDVVLPLVPLLGLWTEATVVKAKNLVKVGKMGAGSTISGSHATGAPAGADAATHPDDLLLPLEYLAAHRELLLAYKLLEADNSLKPGDCVILNAPNSTVGRTLLQLCKLLKLRAVAVLRGKKKAAAGDVGAGGQTADGRFEAVSEQLLMLGATLVLKDEGSVKTQLQSQKFFGKPKIALDAVGGDSAARIAEALEQGGKLVVYGCMSGKAPTWPWQAWVFKGLQVTGFNLRKTLAAETHAGAKKLRSNLESLGRLVSAGLLTLDFTEYRFAEEFQEALEHAIEAPGGSRVLLRF